MLDVARVADDVLQITASVSREDALASLAAGGALVSAMLPVLRDAPWPAYALETPPWSTSTQAERFAFVLVASPALARTVADPSAFAEVLAAADGEVAVFPNLGGDAVLIAPTPGDDHAGHLASFARTASEARQRSLWRAVGEAAAQRLARGRFWLSTAGLGVPWLHVRLDDRPKYYRYAPYRSGGSEGSEGSRGTA